MWYSSWASTSRFTVKGSVPAVNRAAALRTAWPFRSRHRSRPQCAIVLAPLRRTPHFLARVSGSGRDASGGRPEEDRSAARRPYHESTRIRMNPNSLKDYLSIIQIGSRISQDYRYININCSSPKSINCPRTTTNCSSPNQSLQPQIVLRQHLGTSRSTSLGWPRSRGRMPSCSARP